jgi:hypothetical protein
VKGAYDAHTHTTRYADIAVLQHADAGAAPLTRLDSYTDRPTPDYDFARWVDADAAPPPRYHMALYVP